MAVDDPGAVLRGLTEAQLEAVTSPAAPLAVVAGAGSGKTTVLTRRVAHRIVGGTADADHSLVVTFTRKAARELRGRLRRLAVPGPVRAGTLHGAAYGELRRYWADHELRPPGLLADPRRLLRRCLATPGEADAALVRAVAGEIEWAGARLVDPAHYAAEAVAAGRRPPLRPVAVAAAYERYEAAKADHRLLDMNDLLRRAADIVENDPAAAAATRWRIRHLFVDEFQDVNPAQWRLLRAWLGPSTDLFVVGDPRQAVYGWNGADAGLLDRLPQLLPGTTVLRLDDNHRSTPQVVAAAAAVLDLGPDDDPAGRAGRADRAGRAVRPDGPVPAVAGFADEQAEAAAVARWLRVRHRPGTTWSQLAVLARTNARLAPVAAALEAAGIPFRMAASAGDSGTGAVLRLLRTAPPSRPIRSAVADLLSAGGDDEVPAATADGLRRLADEHAVEEPGADVSAFRRWLVATVGRRERLDGERGPDAVTLSSFHRAKGLEWPAVALVGVEAGLVPIAYATTEAAVAEERRLFYVAVTRAEEHLWCSWAKRRADGGAVDATASPFLAAVEAAGRDTPTTAAARTDRIADLRTRIAAAG